MSESIARVEICYEQSVVYARQRAHLIAELLGFDRTDQTRLSTAVSEIARNAYQHAGGGDVEFRVDAGAQAQVFSVTVRDSGPGIANVQAIMEGRHVSDTGLGLGIVGARQLMDHFRIDTHPDEGTTVYMSKSLPTSAPPATTGTIAGIRGILNRARSASPLDEIRLQNQELLRALGEVRGKQEELEQLNQELEATNCGVLALYSELDEKALQLGRLNETQSRFLSTLSHELRTPLNSIVSLARMLLDPSEDGLTTEQTKQVGFIRDAAHDLSSLVTDLLDMARIRAGRLEVHPRVCTTEAIFTGLRDMVRPLSTRSELELTFVVEEGMQPLYTDEAKVAQILRNLLVNAMKFTERGHIRVSARLSDDWRAAVFAVADTGIGIAQDDLAHVFDEYAQVERAQRGRVHGSGLGLPISRQLAELLGGSIRAESRLGAGSTFTATVPRCYEEPRAAAEPDRAHDLGALLVPVLVIDDDPAAARLYESHLRGSEFQVVSVRSIAIARQALRHARPAAIVLDASAASHARRDFLEELEASTGAHSIPVIATASAAKPVAGKWLLERLRAIVRGQPPPTVLIIDDEEAARYVMRGQLASLRCGIVEADSGPKGLQIAIAQQPSAIILDLVMPGLSGFEVLSKLKSTPATCDIPVIITTASTLSEPERHTLEKRALTVLAKDTTSEAAVLHAVRQALREAAKPSIREESPVL